MAHGVPPGTGPVEPFPRVADKGCLVGHSAREFSAHGEGARGWEWFEGFLVLRRRVSWYIKCVTGSPFLNQYSGSRIYITSHHTFSHYPRLQYTNACNSNLHLKGILSDEELFAHLV